MPATSTPVLDRYFEVYHELWIRRRRMAGRQFVRLAALTAVTAEGWPREVGERVKAAETVLQRLPWYDALRGQLAIVAAAVIVTRGLDAGTFVGELERARRLFREEKVSRGGLYETLAILLLWAEGSGQSLSREQVRRFRDVWRAMKSDHRFLVGVATYPLSAALSALPQDPASVAGRVEDIHRRLEEAGVSSQVYRLGAARILALSHDADDLLARRLGRLLDAFRDDGVRIWSSDAPIVAPLAFADVPASAIVPRVAALRERLATLRPRPGKEATFALGCSLQVLELALDQQDGGAWQRVTPAVSLSSVAQLVTALIASSSSGGAAAAIAASG